MLAASPDVRVVALASLTLGIGIGYVLPQFRVQRWRRGYEQLRTDFRVLEQQRQDDERHYHEKIAMLQDNETRVHTVFDNLAHQIIDEKIHSYSSINQERISSLLQPLKEQISGFGSRIETIFTEETRDRASLKQELLHLRELNQRLNEEAAQLSRALTGNRKTQGDWGEMILERLLEHAGLRNGHEYVTQTGWRTNDNRLRKPDVIVRLPGGRDVVIDSKVSLSAWQRYVGAVTDGDRATALEQHLQAIRQHMKSLSGKDYSSLQGITSLDFVLMFIPIDAAFTSVVDNNETLLNEMHARQVIIVTPTTLLAVLRTINHLWQGEKQNRNAREIAERAGALYDKLKSFVDDMERLGRQLDSCRTSFDQAMIKLATGRGSLIDRAQPFPELGVAVKTKMDTPHPPRRDEPTL